ncbi:dicarboxylate/amino acid:cation symporter [Bacillus taeanensis]|uniref:Dicarboxylate/amino acid:cation symporter n=1 Tax=Bacillus taeanensis TaxID=273032 RepID=A0A366XTC4_9BACI|nr:dicarboxylate/amino acid:cation symporter [Bacillus taeanensis]RBW67404.1 dicarboxylate/amino acid:cation symporter [Bacillus taeanensis]
MKLTAKIIGALILGIITGIIFNLFAPGIFPTVDTYLLTPIGQIFLKLIKMLVVPIVFFSIVLGTAGVGDPKKLGRIGAKTIIYFLLTTTIALTIAMSLAYLIQPGEEGAFDTAEASFEAAEAPPVMETFLNMIPTNPIQALANGEMLQIIIFSVFIGLGLVKLGKKGETTLKVIEQGNDIMMYLVMLVMRLAPYGAFALIASAIGSAGMDAIQSMFMYFIVVVVALIVHAVVTYGSAVLLLAKQSPIWFFKEFFPAMTVAFSTATSSGTLPISMDVAQKRLKVPESVSSFVQPLGATINMDGTAIMQGVATVFLAQIYGIDLSMGDLVTVVVTATLASIGTAGVPGVGLIMLAMVLQSVGIPVEGIGLILAVDRLLDMLRTAVNITGDASCALVVAKTEEKHAPAKA